METASPGRRRLPGGGAAVGRHRVRHAGRARGRGPTEALLLDDHHELDLTGTVRDAISLAEPIVALCRPDCRGLCLECGVDLNADPAHTHGEDDIDPRLAALLAIRERLDQPA